MREGRHSFISSQEEKVASTRPVSLLSSSLEVGVASVSYLPA